MQEAKNMAGYPFQVFMSYAEQSNTQQQGEQTLGRLEDGDTAQAEMPDQKILSVIHGYKRGAVSLKGLLVAIR